LVGPLGRHHLVGPLEILLRDIETLEDINILVLETGKWAEANLKAKHFVILAAKCHSTVIATTLDNLPIGVKAC